MPPPIVHHAIGIARRRRRSASAARPSVSMAIAVAPTISTQATSVCAAASALAGARIDADDYLASYESSWDYDPGDGLDRITGPILSINFGDDLLNPAELGATEAAMSRVKIGTAVLIPAGSDTYGHQTLGHPEVWAPALVRFMTTLPRR